MEGKVSKKASPLPMQDVQIGAPSLVEEVHVINLPLAGWLLWGMVPQWEFCASWALNSDFSCISLAERKLDYHGHCVYEPDERGQGHWEKEMIDSDRTGHFVHLFTESPLWCVTFGGICAQNILSFYTHC